MAAGPVRRGGPAKGRTSIKGRGKSKPTVQGKGQSKDVPRGKSPAPAKGAAQGTGAHKGKRPAEGGAARKGKRGADGASGHQGKGAGRSTPAPTAPPRTPDKRAAPTTARRPGPGDEIVIGRNPVTEAMRAGVPARSLLILAGIDHDERVTESLTAAKRVGIPVRETIKSELDRLSRGAPHQGLALVAAPFPYAHADDLLHRALEAQSPALLVALDGVTDPRNLGAVVRSVAAFGGQGVLVPERRSAAMTAGAWKASAGAAARVPVARAVNMTRALQSYASAGLTVIGLAADGEVSLDDLEVAVDPICLVVGSEARGMSRLVAETCDLRVRIPMPGDMESLNASVAAAVVLAEIARRRRLAAASGVVAHP